MSGEILLGAGGILLFFALWGEYKCNTSITDLTKTYNQQTQISGDARQQCNNYIYTQNYVASVSKKSTIQWRRALIISFGSAVITYLLLQNFRSLDSKDWALFIFVGFVLNWGVGGYNDYHVRNNTNQAIETVMQNSAATFTGANACNVFSSRALQ